jgi:hypothetical protein
MRFMVWLGSLVTYLFNPGFKPEDRWKRRVTGFAAVLVIVLLVLGFYVLGAQRALAVPADSADFEATIQARVTHTKLWMAVVLLVAIPLTTLLEWQVLDRTRLWARLMHWADSDTPATQAAKTLGACVIFAALLLGNVLMVSAVLK